MISQVGNTISASEMHSALDAAANRALLASGSFTDFYVYSPNGKDIHCNAKPIAFAEAPWLALSSGNSPDGSEEESIDAEGYAPWILPSVPSPLANFLSFAISSLTQPRQIFQKGVLKPGTGFNHCLGDIRVKRSTDVHIIGICVYRNSV